MKKLILILAAIAAILPAAAYANHQDGFYQGYGSNSISFSFGNNQRARYSHGGNVPFVDYRGRPYDYRRLQHGHPIRVQYTGGHRHRRFQRVIVQQRRGDAHNRGRGRNH